MKKLVAMLMTMAVAAVLGFGSVGCSKDKTADSKKVETKTTTTTTPGDKKTEEVKKTEEKKTTEEKK